jgi:adenosylcobinamide-GDP ribazoletransferase
VGYKVLRSSHLQRNGFIGDTIRSLGFLSRLPLPQSWFENTDDSLLRNARAFPLAGAVLGLLSGLGLMAANSLHLPALACGFIAVGALAAMTGALHEDGLGDTADGFFGGATPDRRLDIMKDSRIGTFAALTLIIWVGIKVSLLAAIIERAGPGYALLALVASEAASRSAMLAFWHSLPSARPGGLADSVGAPSWETVVCGAALGFGRRSVRHQRTCTRDATARRLCPALHVENRRSDRRHLGRGATNRFPCGVNRACHGPVMQPHFKHEHGDNQITLHIDMHDGR